MVVERADLLQRQRVVQVKNKAIEKLVNLNGPEERVEASLRLMGMLKQNEVGWMVPRCVRALTINAARGLGWTDREIVGVIRSGRRVARLDNARRQALSGDK